MDNKYIKALLWILVLCLYLFLNITFAIIIDSFHIKNELLLNGTYILGELIITCILVYLYRKDFKNKFNELKNKDGNSKLVYSIKSWLIGLLFMFAFNIILGYIIGSIAGNEEANRSLISNNYLYAIISMIIFAPVCEEIIFRLSISKVLDNKYIYIIFSGLMFGLAHILGESGLQTLYILPYASLGIAFASIYHKTNNILCSIIMHALHNSICIGLLFII